MLLHKTMLLHNTAKYLSLTVIMTAIICTALVGCGGTSEDVIESRKAGQQAYDNALQSMAAKDYAAAKEQLETAIKHGRLQLDVKATAYTKLAACQAATGDISAAHATLDDLQQQAPNMDEVFAARSFVFQQEGKTKQAKAAWAKARRMNRYVEKIGG